MDIMATILVENNGMILGFSENFVKKINIDEKLCF
jgi:hypothetical protein